MDAGHKLHDSWCFWYQKKDKRTANWYEGISVLGQFSTVEQFWSLYSHMVRPDSHRGTALDIMLFRDGIKPMVRRDCCKAVFSSFNFGPPT